MPFSCIPGDLFDEAGLKNPEKGGFGKHWEVSDRLERGFVFFLNKDSGQVVVLGREGHLLRAHDSDEAAGGGPAEFYGSD